MEPWLTPLLRSPRLSRWVRAVGSRLRSGFGQSTRLSPGQQGIRQQHHLALWVNKNGPQTQNGTLIRVNMDNTLRSSAGSCFDPDPIPFLGTCILVFGFPPKPEASSTKTQKRAPKRRRNYYGAPTTRRRKEVAKFFVAQSPLQTLNWVSVNLSVLPLNCPSLKKHAPFTIHRCKHNQQVRHSAPSQKPMASLEWIGQRPSWLFATSMVSPKYVKSTNSGSGPRQMVHIAQNQWNPSRQA